MTKKHTLKEVKHWTNQSETCTEPSRYSSDEQTIAPHQQAHPFHRIEETPTTKTTCVSPFTPHCALRFLPAITASVALLGAITTYQILAPNLTNTHKGFTEKNETHVQSRGISTSTAQRETQTLANGSLFHSGGESEIHWKQPTRGTHTRVSVFCYYEQSRLTLLSHNR